jgi:poly(3-hydroxybutyrate) depolymerase
MHFIQVFIMERPFANFVANCALILALIGSSVKIANAQLGKLHPAYEQAFHQGMRYGLFKPITYISTKSYPLIVYLHGSTDTVSHDLSWYQEEVQKENPCFVLSPKTTEPNQGWGNTWEQKHSPAMEKTLSLVDSIVKKYNIDKDRLYIYGISMGAFGTFSVLAKEPQKFAGAYAVCGGSDLKAASKITTPLWIFHGAEDDVVPVRLSKNMYDKMVEEGNKTVRYTEYANVKHNSWENVSREKTLAPWLLSQKKGTAGDVPDQVSGLTVEKLYNSTARLRWNKQMVSNETDKDVWYYKVFRDKIHVAEVDGDVTEFNDYKYNSDSPHEYHIVAVNYFFKESKPSVPIKMK